MSWNHVCTDRGLFLGAEPDVHADQHWQRAADGHRTRDARRYQSDRMGSRESDLDMRFGRRGPVSRQHNLGSWRYLYGLGAIQTAVGTDRGLKECDCVGQRLGWHANLNPERQRNPVVPVQAMETNADAARAKQCASSIVFK